MVMIILIFVGFFLIRLPEALTLLIFGAGLQLLTLLLKKILHRYDNGKESRKELEKIR